tara:strand:+ start:1112 stop:1801 length:690 start_codon:yes stop_codon:yes gene_type:complete
MSIAESARVISKYVEGISIEADVSATPIYTIRDTTNASGWTLDGANGVIQWRGFIDLSGYRIQNSDMVLSPMSVSCQYGGAFFSTAGATAPGGNIFLQYAVTTDKVDDLDFGVGQIAEPLVGFIGDNSEMEQVIYAGTEAWGPASAGLAMVNMQKMVFGDAPQIVGPRIYVCIRGVLSPAVQSGSFVDTIFSIPPMRFVIAGMSEEVPDHQLLYLMARQYDLQQTPDVD